MHVHFHIYIYLVQYHLFVCKSVISPSTVRNVLLVVLVDLVDLYLL